MLVTAHAAGSGYVIGGLAKAAKGSKHFFVALHLRAGSQFFNQERLERRLRRELADPLQQRYCRRLVRFGAEVIGDDSWRHRRVGRLDAYLALTLRVHEVPAKGYPRLFINRHGLAVAIH